MEPAAQNVYKVNVFWESFDGWVVRDGAMPAYVDTDRGQIWSRQDLAQLADTVGQRLRPFAGALVAVHLPNGPEFVATVLAAWRQGSPVLPLDVDVDALVADRLCVSLQATALVNPAGVWPREMGAAVSRELVAGAALIKLTSGSTGAPRGVRLGFEALRKGAGQIAETMGIGSEDRTLLTLPLSHSYGFDNGLLMLVVLGVPIVAARDLTPSRLCKVIRKHRPTVWPAIPFLLDVLTRSRGVSPEDLVSLRLVISAGALLPVRTRAQFEDRFGITPRNFYGSTECGGITFDREGARDSPEGSVGTPLVGVRVTLDGAGETGVGRVRVDSPSVAETYLPEPSPELSEGCFLTSDIGRLDESGRLILLGRASDVVNIGARKVYPAEVESVIRDLPGVQDVVVMAADREAAGESIRAIVVSHELNARSIRDACAAILPAWKVPRRIELRETLPRNARGKLDRRLL